MPIFVDGFSGTIFGTWRRKLITACAVITGITGVVVGVAKAAPIVEPWWYASHGWVREESHNPLLQRIIKVQLKQNHDERKQLLEEAKTRELELMSDQAKLTPQYHELVQNRVTRIKERLDELDKDDNSLFNEKVSK